MTEDDALHGHTTRRTKVEDFIAVSEPGGHVHLYGEVGLALSEACCGERLLLACGEAAPHADLTDDAGAHLSPARTFGDVADDLLRNIVLALPIVLRRLRCIKVVAGTHDDVEAGGATDFSKTLWVSAVSVRTRLDDALSTLRHESLQLFHRKHAVGHRAVVLVDEWIVTQLPEVLHRDLLVNKRACARRIVERWMPPREHIVQDVFVSQRQT